MTFKWQLRKLWHRIRYWRWVHPDCEFDYPEGEWEPIHFNFSDPIELEPKR